jgi:exosortase/archaeosortase family protein
MFLFIMLLFPGKLKAKFWFIPFSLLLIYFVAILRIVFLGLVYKFQPSWFDFLHKFLFNVLFFLIFFLLWLVWVKWFYKKNPVFSKSDLKPKED